MSSSLSPPAGRLPLRFAVISASLLLLCGTTASLVLARSIEHRARISMEEDGRTIAAAVVDPLFTTDELLDDAGLGAELYEAVDAALARGFRDLPVERVKVFGADGTIVYSDESRNVGNRPEPGDELLAALGGSLVSELQVADESDESHEFETSLGDQLEVFVPIRRQVDATDERVVGVVEVYLPYAATRAAVSSDVRRLWGVLASGLLLLWLALWRAVTGVARNLSEQHERNRWLAMHDSLTRLPNRVSFEHDVVDALSDGVPCAVLLVDLDRFKDVNDTLGHQAGDQLLCEVADRLVGVVRGDDVVSRLGGDEFGLLLLGESGASRARDIAARVVAALEERVTIGEVAFDVGASVGIARPEDGDDFDTLIRRADIAMYQAKTDALGVCEFDRSIAIDTTSRLLLFGDLRRAIQTGDVEIAFQPKVDISTGRVAGIEALARWERPGHGPVPPDVFIPLAEQTGLIADLTRIVLERSIGVLSALRLERPSLGLSVNLSARDLLDSQLIEDVLRMLDRYAVPPEALELEITETSAMRDPHRSLAVLEALRSAGMTVAIDDYGTGYSSLAYLRSLPVSVLKIDRAFVMDVTTSDGNEAIVRSTVDLGRNLGMRVVAEGVEDEGSWRLLRDIGCNEAQGYWLARPTDVAGVRNAIAEVEARLVALMTIDRVSARVD